MRRAVIYGSAMASFTVEKFGTERLLNIKENELEARIEAFIGLMQVDMVIA
jgi:hypothetical protein